jgi:hypothetical protein
MSDQAFSVRSHVAIEGFLSDIGTEPNGLLTRFLEVESDDDGDTVVKGGNQGPRRTPMQPFHVARGIAPERERYLSGAARAAIASPGCKRRNAPKGLKQAPILCSISIGSFTAYAMFPNISENSSP